MSHINMVRGPRPHTHPVSLYWGVFFALVVLTILTVYVASIDFGKWNIIVALAIAGTKALLVMSVFMHLAFDNKFLGVVAATSFVFLALFILFPILDMGSRTQVDDQRANFLPRNERIYKYEKKNPKALPLRPGLKEPDKENLKFIGPGEH